MTSGNDFLSVESADRISTVKLFLRPPESTLYLQVIQGTYFPSDFLVTLAMLFPVPRGQGGNAAQKGLSGLLLADNFRFCPLVLQEEEELAFPRE